MGEKKEASVLERPLERPLHVQTPLLKSKKLSDKAGCSVWLKLENVQNSGSFKARGLGYLSQKVVFLATK